ncbi:MAG TPA: hypothetical protein VGC89_18550 [Pyrinomonadaceae bacterium]
MQPQYIYDNSVTPPVQSTLQYTISPDTLWITTSNKTQTVISLIITVFNNSQQPVNCNFFTFGIQQCAAAGCMTTDASSVRATSDQPATWNNPSYQQGGDPNYPNYYLYRSTPVSGTMKVMQPGDTLIFRLNNIKVLKVEGTAQVFIREKANNDIVTGTLADTILSNNTLEIVNKSFEATPGAPIDPGDSATLSWAILNADHWKLYNNDTDALLYNGNASSIYPTGTQPFKPLQNTNFKLIAYADAAETQHVSDYATVMVNHITLKADINGQHQVTVDSNKPQTINWTTRLANRVMLHASDGTPDQVKTVPASGSGTFQVTPTRDTIYIVSAYYEDDGQSPPAFSTPVTQEIDVTVNAPTIRSFKASTLVPSQGASLKLSWETQSTSTCTISPDGGAFTGPAALKGSTQVNPPPDENTIYTLAASSGPASATQSLPAVRPMMHGWSNITWPSDWVFSSEPHLFNFNRQLWLVDTWCADKTGAQTAFRVWRTNDGLTWTAVPGKNLPPVRQNAVGVVFNDGRGEKMWLLGGESTLNGPTLNEIWWSSDGANWTKAQTSGTSWAARKWHACVAFNNKLWVLGGLDQWASPNVLFYKDVWSSPDGVAWTKQPTPPWSATYGLGAAVFNGKLWVCGGSTYTTDVTTYAEAWYTTDGVSWQQWNNGATPPQTNTPWGALTGVTLLTPNDHLWLISGANMWTMDSNGAWALVSDAFLLPNIYKVPTTVFDWRIWVVASWFNPPAKPPVAWAAAYYVP